MKKVGKRDVEARKKFKMARKVQKTIEQTKKKSKNKRNIPAVALKLGLSERTVSRLLGMQRKAIAARAERRQKVVILRKETKVHGTKAAADRTGVTRRTVERHTPDLTRCRKAEKGKRRRKSFVHGDDIARIGREALSQSSNVIRASNIYIR
jgi:hypothetical protein